MSEAREELEKRLAEAEAPIQRIFGIRILTAFQCIKCGIIFDNPDDIFYNSTYVCNEVKNDRSEKKYT